VVSSVSGQADAAPLLPRAPPAVSCPGISNGLCAYPCQRSTCDGLAAFFAATYNDTIPWEERHSKGWIGFKETTCAQLLPRTAAAAAPPPYCSWFGVRCCRPEDLAARRCWAVHSVVNITINAENVNGSTSDPKLLDALEQLHACGLTGLNLESNEITGELVPRWGTLTNLTVLNLGEWPCA